MGPFCRLCFKLDFLMSSDDEEGREIDFLWDEDTSLATGTSKHEEQMQIYRFAFTSLCDSQPLREHFTSLKRDRSADNGENKEFADGNHYKGRLSMSLGRYVRAIHHSSTEEGMKNISDEDVTQEMSERYLPEDIEDGRMEINVAVENFNFYTNLGDSIERVFESTPALEPPIYSLCKRALSLLHLCCRQHLSAGEIEAIY
eukprot:IDg21255t1